MLSFEDSFAFSPPSSPSDADSLIPSSPPSSPSILSPPDVYRQMEKEEFGEQSGEEQEEEESLESFKSSRMDLNLELQLLVAENRQLQKKIETINAEKNDAVQMWRKTREENKVRSCRKHFIILYILHCAFHLIFF